MMMMIHPASCKQSSVKQEMTWQCIVVCTIKLILKKYKHQCDKSSITDSTEREFLICLPRNNVLLTQHYSEWNPISKHVVNDFHLADLNLK
jgi:hypothetical protein